MQDCSNSGASATELLQSCDKPSKYPLIFMFTPRLADPGLVTLSHKIITLYRLPILVKLGCLFTRDLGY